MKHFIVLILLTHNILYSQNFFMDDWRAKGWDYSTTKRLYGDANPNKKVTESIIYGNNDEQLVKNFSATYQNLRDRGNQATQNVESKKLFFDYRYTAISNIIDEGSDFIPEPWIKIGISMLADFGQIESDRLARNQKKKVIAHNSENERAVAKKVSAYIASTSNSHSDYHKRLSDFLSNDSDWCKEADCVLQHNVDKAIYKILQKNEQDLKENYERDRQFAEQTNLRLEDLKATDQQLQKQILDNHQESLNRDKAQIEKIIEIEEFATAAFNEFQVEIEENTRRISQLEKDMNRLKYKVDDLKRKTNEHSTLIKKNALMIDVMREGITNNTKAIADNAVKIAENANRIEEIQFDKTPLAQKIKLVEQGEYANLFPTAAEKEKFLKNAKNIKLRQDVSITCQTISEYGKVALEFLNTTGLTEKFGKDFGKVANYVMTAVNITGSIFSGNYANAVMSALGLFSKPQPSIEQQMLEQVMDMLKDLNENMNERFDKVHEHLDFVHQDLSEKLVFIAKKMDGLESKVDFYHKESMKKMSLLDQKLNIIDCKIDVMATTLAQIVSDETFGQCRLPYDNIRSIVEFDSIDAYIEHLESIDCVNCLNSLFSIFRTRNIYHTAFNNLNGNNCSDAMGRPILSDQDIFNHLRAILDDITFDEQIKKEYATLLLNPPSKLFYASDIINNVSTGNVRIIQRSEALKHYLSVNEFVKYFVTFYQALLLYDNNLGNRFYSTDDIINNPKDRRILHASMEYVRDLVDASIQQQTLLSGIGLYDVMFEHCTASERTTNTDRSFDVINNNPVLARNFLVHILHRNLKVARSNNLQLEKFYADIEALRRKRIETVDLSVYFGARKAQWMDIDIRNGYAYLVIDRGENEETGKILKTSFLIPHAYDEIRNCDYLPNNGLRVLMESKKLLENMLIERELFNAPKGTQNRFPSKMLEVVIANSN